MNVLVRSTFLTRANPVAKIFVMFTLTLGVILSIDLVSSTVAFACIAVLLPFTGVPLLRVLRQLWIIPVAAFTTAWATVLMAPAGGPVLLQLGPLTFTQEPLLLGLALFIRSLVMILPCVLLAMSIDSTELADSLVQILRLPERFVLAALAAARLMGILAADLQTLLAARRARGVARRGPLGALIDFFPVSLALLVEAMRRGGRLAMAMEGRAFGTAGRTWSRTVRLDQRDWLVMGGSVLLAAAAITAAAATGHWNFILD